MHLGGHDPALTGHFIAALDEAIAGVTELFLLGDLFEAWTGDDTADPAAEALADALARLADTGVRTRVLRGNRDFLLGCQPSPPAVAPYPRRARFARGYRDASEASKQAKAGFLMDVNPGAVDRLMDAAGADLLVHGHTHRPAIHHWQHAGRQRERWVLPDWTLEPRRGGFLRIDASGWSRLGDW